MDDLVKQLSALPTSTLSDALDRLGLPGQIPHVRPVDRSFRLAGVAYTLQYAPVGDSGGTVGDFIDEVPAGSVIAIANEGRLTETVWGDLLTTVASSRGISGTVIDGVCRDTPRSLELKYPIFSRGTYMRTGKDRVTLVATQVEIRLSETPVRPGDLVFGDADGVLAFPAAAAHEVLEVATQIELAENGIRALVLAGHRLDHARREFGYHTLQTNVRHRDDAVTRTEASC